MSSPGIVNYYIEFRTVIFLSSLTLGTFLFTMKTFIVQTLKKEVYDHDSHKKRIEDRASQAGISPEYFKSLRRLANFMMLSIYLALMNAFFQITIGYIDSKWAAIFCILTSLISWFVFTIVLYLVGANMNDLLDFAEEDARISSGRKK